MAVERIERVIGGVVVASAATASQYEDKGKFHVRAFGATRETVLQTLDEVAVFLRDNPKSSVRMNPKWARISRDIYVDGVPLRDEAAVPRPVSGERLRMMDRAIEHERMRRNRMAAQAVSL